MDEKIITFLHEVGQKRRGWVDKVPRDKVNNGINFYEALKGVICMMKQLINAQKIIYPDLLEVMRKRYVVLYTISLYGPIGRRGLVENSQLTERYIRNEVDLLHTQGLVDVTTKGMLITDEGKDIILELHQFIRELTGLTALERKLQEKTGITQVIIVPGDSDAHPFVKQELGRATVSFLKEYIDSNVTISVTGGTTMAAVADAMMPMEQANCLFVPARGGVGEKVENQANTIVAKMAKAEKGDYRLLHVPDPLSETLYQTLINEPSIAEIVAIIAESNILIHGIGEAIAMAGRRKTSVNVLEKLTNEQAVSEAFGYYFNKEGKIVHKVRTIGIQLAALEEVDCVITVAGGKSKAQAIASFMKQAKGNVLITDEAAAKEIVSQKLI